MGAECSTCIGPKDLVGWEYTLHNTLLLFACVFVVNVVDFVYLIC